MAGYGAGLPQSIFAAVPVPIVVHYAFLTFCISFLPIVVPSGRTVNEQLLGRTMTFTRVPKICVTLTAFAALAACGGRSEGSNDRFIPGDAKAYMERSDVGNPIEKTDRNNSIWDVFKKTSSDTEVAVNKYLWSASLEVLNFLPIQLVDPFSGVIVTGYGTPPDGNRAYRATIYVKDPALDARSLVVAMQTRGGGSVAAGTQRAIEDAILSRARQLRIADKKL